LVLTNRLVSVESFLTVREQNMRNYKVGDHLRVKLSGGRIVEATIKAFVETTEDTRLQVSLGSETALIYLWQVIKEQA
jgi:hypothetical protein